MLSVKDWITFVQNEIAKRPEKKIRIDERNTPIWTTQINVRGQPYCGMGVRSEQIQRHKERWDKIIRKIGQITTDEI